ncbi:hypothetical protein [Streptomyces sp. PvR018]|uniref:hypothetical protein n=1 Tax=Streptomyces sp. PvR018 TaxID=3156442 RepID=UPI001A2F6357|nr:hypothetical protein [Streptomyces sp. MBT57]
MERLSLPEEDVTASREERGQEKDPALPWHGLADLFGAFALVYRLVRTPAWFCVEPSPGRPKDTLVMSSVHKVLMLVVLQCDHTRLRMVPESPLSRAPFAWIREFASDIQHWPSSSHTALGYLIVVQASLSIRVIAALAEAFIRTVIEKRELKAWQAPTTSAP